MGYSILYNWQFIRSECGLTPVILMGDSENITLSWIGNHWGERRARNWGCLFDMIGVTDDEFMNAIQRLTGKTSQEHWQRSGKWVNDKGLINWAKNACKNAVSVEEIKDENWNIAIDAAISVENEHYKMLEQSINSTAELDEWIYKAKRLCVELQNTGNLVRPIIEFGREDIIRHSTRAKHTSKPSTKNS